MSDLSQETVTTVTERLDAISGLLSRAGGMAITTGNFELVSLIGEAGCDLDAVINDLEDTADA